MRASLQSIAARPGALQLRYEITDELARGGMGIVYKATDRVVGRELAYKRLHVENEASRARATALFQREYNTLVQLAHPGIVEVYDYGTDDHGPYYTMELLSGSDLMALAPMPYRDLCRVLRDVASALALVHARRLIHRDISPGNVRLTADGRGKLLDFGALTPFGTPPDLVGTPAFMAPECLAGDALDHRADLYSLGALAYFALTRKPVVRVRTLEELSEAWTHPVEPPSLHAAMPKPLEELVLWLLHKDAASRPASAAEVVERLTAIGELAPEANEQKVAYSYLAHPPLVGRSEPVQSLDTALERVMEKHGRAILIEAPPGAGRSALLNHLTREAQLAGATVLRADASADAGAFGLARALTRMGLSLHPDLLDTNRARDTHFAQLLGPQRGARPENTWSPLEASQRQARTLSLMETLLIGATERNPTVILIDELHRGDPESLALLASLAEDAARHPMLLVLSASENATDSDAYAKISAVAQHITLRNLTEQDTLELVKSVFGGVANSHRLARFLFEQSAGNPGRTMDLARLLLSRGLIRYNRGTFTLPYDVSVEGLETEGKDAWLARLADVSEQAREIASFLSVQEMPIELALLGEALDLEPRPIVLALEELQAREIARVHEATATLSSMGLRAALSAALSDEQRRNLHLKAGHALLKVASLSGELRMQAGIHLLKGGEELKAAELLTQRSDGDWLGGKTPIPLLEAVLDVLRRQGRSDEQCLNALVPLVRGGFFGDMRAQRRHLDRTLQALANVCGVTTAVKLTPKLGPKLGLITGVLWAAVRHAFTPKKERFGTFKETISALLSILSATTAACSSAFDSADAFRIVRTFEPLRAFGSDSAPYLTIEFCLATAELGSGRFASSMERYTRLLERFERPVQGMEPEVHLQFRQGILHGLAQGKVVDARPEALTLADELEEKHVFFAPHAQVIRASYYGARGEQDLSDMHRKRGELLALRGGISWSSVTVMTMRSLYIAIATTDVVNIVRLLPEFERLSDIAPKILLFRQAAEASLELFRGHAEQAVQQFEALLENPDAGYMPAHYAELVLYARALTVVGRVDEAKQVCIDALAGLGPNGVRTYFRSASQQLAQIEALQGDRQGARHRLESLLTELEPYDNPLWLGLVHRDLALFALEDGDHDHYDLHFAAMSRYFRSTRNPALAQQVERVNNQAETTRLAALPRPAPANLSDELDDMSTSMETDEDRIAELTQKRPRRTGPESLPPNKPRKLA